MPRIRVQLVRFQGWWAVIEDIGKVVLGSSVSDNRRDVVDHYGDMPNETIPALAA